MPSYFYLLVSTMRKKNWKVYKHKKSIRFSTNLLPRQIICCLFFFLEIMECIVAIKLIAPSIVFARLSTMSFKTPYSTILAAIGILTGVFAWVMNIVQYNSMRNQMSQSPTSDQPIHLNNEPTRGNDMLFQQMV